MRQSIIIVLLSVACSLVFSIRYLSTSAPGEDLSLVVTPPQLILDFVYPGSVQRRTLRFHNPRPENFEVLSFASSCSCSMAEIPAKTIGGGQNVDVVVTYHVPMSRGRQSQSLKLIGRYPGEEWKEIIIPLTAVIRALFTIEPETLVIDDVPVGEAVIRTISIKYDAENLPTSPAAVLRHDPLIRSSIEAFRPAGSVTNVRLTILPDRACHRHAELTLDVGVPGLPPVEYPIRVTAKSRFPATPTEINFGALTEGQRVQATLRFATDGKAFLSSTAPPDVIITPLNHDSSSCSFTVTFTPSTLRRNRILREEIAFSTGNDREPLAYIPLLAMVCQRAGDRTP